MARYEHLPIYKAAMDLTVYIEQVVRHVSRYHKYTLGSDLRQQNRDLRHVLRDSHRLPGEAALVKHEPRTRSGTRDGQSTPSLA